MKKKIRFFHHLLLGAVLLITMCVSANGFAQQPQEQQTNLYINPQPIQITGYDGNPMEPFISPDGRFLFFNTDEDPKTLHYAARNGLLTFQYLGELKGIASHGKTDGMAPSLDMQGRIYFTSMRQFDDDRHSVFTGNFNGREVTGLHVIQGDISPPQEFGLVNMDVSISPDGNVLYISRTKFSLSSVLFGAMPSRSKLLIAYRNGDQFKLDLNSDAILKNINTAGLQYAPSISADGLELYYTRADEETGTQIMVASRRTQGEPFGRPCVINTVSGFVEAPSISLDRKEMFIHKKVDDKFVIFRLERNSNPVACN